MFVKYGRPYIKGSIEKNLIWKKNTWSHSSTGIVYHTTNNIYLIKYIYMYLYLFLTYFMKIENANFF